ARSIDKMYSLSLREYISLYVGVVSASHTYIRKRNRNNFRPKQVILKAAGFAAYYSKAKGMETAPVMYTKVKYVHKPKGSPPGAAAADREEVVMVPPVNPKDIN